ncbi:hypothetical protein LR48_Vigan10g167500 [Vigna angularis]|uniref:Uncharacterized protein n=1 Tax=Phaseolus angularis TaxID=3914 RepID=A0A0L9VLD3_PHAAN|nr:hypothetical protein LR48_Vigan10g167500 [Vigna angularis]
MVQNRRLLMERKVGLIPTMAPEFGRELERRQWENLASYPSLANIAVVKEFYTNAKTFDGATHEMYTSYKSTAHRPSAPFWALERRRLEAWASSLRLGRRRPSLFTRVPLLGRLSSGGSKLGRFLQGLSVEDHHSALGRPKWGL